MSDQISISESAQNNTKSLSFCKIPRTSSYLKRGPRHSGDEKTQRFPFPCSLGVLVCVLLLCCWRWLSNSLMWSNLEQCGGDRWGSSCVEAPKCGRASQWVFVSLVHACDHCGHKLHKDTVCVERHFHRSRVFKRGTKPLPAPDLMYGDRVQTQSPYRDQ